MFAGRQAGRQAGLQATRQACLQAGRQVCRQAGMLAGMFAGKQVMFAGRQVPVNMPACKHACLPANLSGNFMLIQCIKKVSRFFGPRYIGNDIF